MSAQFRAALAVLPDYLSQHVLLSLSAMLLGAAVSLPLAVWVARRPRAQWPALALARLVQTIPALALLALFYPLLLALSAVTQRLFGASIPALGFAPALLALALYAMLPILANTIAAIAGVDPQIIEAADAVGMTRRQRLWRVELPIAAPVIMSGLRTAMVWTIGAATLATPVGQTSLGNYIFSGLQTENWVSVLFGCVAAALVALVADNLLALVEAGATRRDWRRSAAGAGGLALGAMVALTPLWASSSGAYIIGGKNFSEQYILADLMAMRMESAGLTVERRLDLGSAVAFRALTHGDIDTYVDYSGTIWTNVLKRNDAPPRDVMLQELGDALRRSSGVTLLGPVGFENAYTLALRRTRAEELGLTSIEDLARMAQRLTLGADLEFLQRPEWSALREKYGLRFRAERAFNPTFMYRALQSGEVDVITAFSSDGRILADDLVTLADPRGAIPRYDAIILLAPKRAGDVALRAALEPLVGAIDLDRIRAANLAVDRDQDKITPQQAARRLAQTIGLALR